MKNNCVRSIAILAFAFGFIVSANATEWRELVQTPAGGVNTNNRLCAASSDTSPTIDCTVDHPEVLAGGVISATGISVSGVISASELWVNGISITASGSGGASINSLTDIADVSVASPATSATLIWNGANWVAGPAVEGCSSTATVLSPNMSSASSNGYTASASSQYSGSYPAWEAFDAAETNGDGWISSNGTTSGWLRLQLPAAKAITQYAIYFHNVGSSYGKPASWTFEGSNDASSWTTLDSQTGQTFSDGDTKAYSFSNTTEYAYYQINVSAASSQYILINELYLYENVTVCTGADNLGDHTATQALAMGGYDITGAAHIGAASISTTSNIDVSGTVKVSGSTGDVCDGTTLGTIRRNPTTGYMELCVMP